MKQTTLWADFVVRNYEVDVHNRASIVTIANYLQEAAGQHADHLEIGVRDLLKHDWTWVLTRLKIEMQHFPAQQEVIKVLTYPIGFDKYFVYRNFILFNAQEEEIGRAQSTWAVMDIQARKMIGVPEIITSISLPTDPPFVEQLKGRVAKIKAPQYQESFKVRWFDLDTNNHTNNAYYLQWVIESLPEEVLKNKQLASVDIMYRMETVWKDEIIGKAESTDDQSFVHQLVRQSDQKELAQAATTWR
ncbi:hypothetical protein BKI52_42170 [marine bacterium AO1-C]|nr:hypothetical protein BKI52_42170 [marine bacterium AO1-C]